MTKAEFASKKWGVFCHYLNGIQNGTGPHNTRGKVTSWQECVEEFDCEKLASQLSELGASYLVFTMQQGTRHFIAPNETLEKEYGIQDGCAKRDLVLDLYEALSKRGIDLFLYYTGDGIYRDEDPEIVRKFGRQSVDKNGMPTELVERWAKPLKEYALRYGKKVSGWWLDGMYDAIGYDDEKLKIMRDAIKAGNPDALIANNYYGCFVPGSEKEVKVNDRDVILADFYQSIAPPTPYCDFTAGEVVFFNAYPDPSRTWDAVPHVLSFLGLAQRPYEVYDGWGAGGCKYSPEYLASYVKGVNELGGVVSIDMRLYRDGSLAEEQKEALKLLAQI